MTQQINLYEARLRPRHKLATARSLGLGAAILLAMVSAFAGYARLGAERRGAELSEVQAAVRAEQERVTALAKAVAERRVSPALSAELAKIRMQLETRQEVVDVLASGSLGNTEGFSGVMFGFARQAQADVWLTGFSVAGGGEEIEIRGRLLDPAKLPPYVQRLSNEPVFRGRRFAMLDMHNVEPEVPKADAAAAAQAPATVTSRYVEFVLRTESVVGGTHKDFGAAAGGKP